MSHHKTDSALSNPVAVFLLVAITVILAALVALLIDLPAFDTGILSTPSFLQILCVFHMDEQGRLNYDSRIILIHNGSDSLENRNLTAEFFRNGSKLPVTVETMNGDLFISTHHYGIQTMGGLGCSGLTWLPKEKISLDFSDGTFHPGDTIRMDIFSKTSGTLVSRHTFLA
ncbi:MAG: type IV pilin [Methanomicrobiales archaeon]|nr:type IV pilin N-terminal domain-containing protein [Burkholderiaceae bacterium]NLH26002.1 type IV pilin [Methanomicrobiales archaeon]HMZ30867.1 type IV pilin N-terminal domain-containing protein [Methanoregulaceae archaeon]HNL85743.1 type IV pilin N-terminal domain-containing protein [Methanoregulaceae archaeon]HNO08775.1 type IV pilin N-terminal domain-containing protein [Methanoregulaceae archaeon]